MKHMRRIYLPLVACLLALSAWPAAVSHRSFGGQLTKSADDFRFSLSSGIQSIPPTVFPPGTRETSYREALREGYRRASLATRGTLAKELEELDGLSAENLDDR